MKKLILLAAVIMMMFQACGQGQVADVVSEPPSEDTPGIDNPETVPDLSGEDSIATDEHDAKAEDGVKTWASEAERIGRLDANTYNGRVIVVFRDGLKVRLRGGKLVSIRGADLTAVNDLLKPYEVNRLFRALSEDGYDRQRAMLQERTGKELPDLNLSFEIMIDDPDEAWNIAKKLEEFSPVEGAYMEARSILPAASTTPDYQGQQGHLSPDVDGNGPSVDGIDADFASTVPGGTGSGVNIIDIENAWNLNHEDLPGGITLLSGTMSDKQGSIDHGTAVVGMLVAIDDGFGVTGIVPDATLNVVTWHSQAREEAIDDAASHLSAGDIMLLEGQMQGPQGTGLCNDTDDDGCVPEEWDSEAFKAIQTATAAGIIVVEAAGNGDNDLGNTAVYGNAFNISLSNSGAIMVGAGLKETHTRHTFSNYGSRVQLQGWGSDVVTAGDGDLNDLGPNRLYTDTFNGTSSASAMVAGALAALQGIYLDATGTVATSDYLRDLLISTGTPYLGTDHIGSFPNLKPAIAKMVGEIAPTGDNDGDGLSNQEEWNLGTDFWRPDSDGDGLNDGDEVHQHGSNPLDRDTDDDGLNDGEEIEIGTNVVVSDNPVIPIIISMLLDDEVYGQSCTEERDCLDNQDCLAGTCHIQCRDNDECPTPFYYACLGGNGMSNLGYGYCVTYEEAYNFFHNIFEGL